MSSKEHAERLAKALESTGMVQPVNLNHSEDRVGVLCRVLPGNDREWTGLVRMMLLATDAESGEAHAWHSHICRHYFLKEDSDGSKKLVFGWSVAIHSPEMSTSLDYLIRVIKGEEPGKARAKTQGEVMEMPLSGVKGKRNQYRGGKGAYTVGGPDDFHPGRR